MVQRIRVSCFLFLFVLVLGSGLFRGTARADDHLVTPADLHKMLMDSANSREDNIGKIQKFLSSDLTNRALGERKSLLTKVDKALPYLSDDELKQLASQTQQIEGDVAAGALTNQQITYIIIALATAVIILILVAA
jgi:hypothetical protein